MNYVYVVLSHRLEPDELAVMKAWTDKDEAEQAAQGLRDIYGGPPTAIEVRCIPCA